MMPGCNPVFAVTLAFVLPATHAVDAKLESTRASTSGPPGQTASLEPAIPEEVDQFETVQPPTPSLPFSTMVGRFHPALAHFPIGWLIALAVIDAVTFLARRVELNTAGNLLLGATVAAFAAAAATGLLRATQLPNDQNTLHDIAVHRNVMLVTAGLVATAAVLRWVRRGPLTGARKAAYLGFVFVGATLVLLGGHLGGRLVFGDAYLPF